MLPRCHLAGGDAEGLNTKPLCVGARALQKLTMTLLSEVWKAVSPHSCHKQESFSKSSLLFHCRPKCTHDHKRPAYILLQHYFILDIYGNALTNTYPYTLFLIESRSTLCEMYHTLHGYYSSELNHKCLISLMFDILLLKLDFRTSVYECLPPVALPPSGTT